MQAVRAGLIRVVQVLRGRLTIEQGCVREGFIVSRVGDVHGSMLVVRIAGRGGGEGGCAIEVWLCSARTLY